MGRRQIGAFHLAGDVFGLEDGRFTAEAIVITTVRLAKRLSLAHLAEEHAAVAQIPIRASKTRRSQLAASERAEKERQRTASLLTQVKAEPLAGSKLGR